MCSNERKERRNQEEKINKQKNLCIVSNNKQLPIQCSHTAHYHFYRMILNFNNNRKIIHMNDTLAIKSYLLVHEKQKKNEEKPKKKKMKINETKQKSSLVSTLIQLIEM